MRKSWVGFAVVLILAIRLYFAFSTPLYTTDDAYLHIRSVESLTEGKVLWEDPLGYGGRTLIHSPLFDALLAFFSFFMPLSLVYKLIPNIFASLLVIPAFLISYKLTKNNVISFLIAFLASIVPAFISNTFNQISTLTLAIPVFFFLLYAWMMIPKKRWVYTFLALLVFFVFLHPLSILFVLTIGLYIVLVSLEKTKTNLAEYELGLFGLFFTLWASFIIYKKLILIHGLAVVWRNIPKGLLSNFFSSFSMLSAFWQIGVLPLVGGTYILYKKAFKHPRKEITLLLSTAIISTAMLWLKLIDVTMGFTLLGITLTLLLAEFCAFFLDYVKKTKIAKHTNTIFCIGAIVLIASVAYPAYIETKLQLLQTITLEESTALQWLNEEISENAIVMAPAHYGSYITSIAKRKNVMDGYFFLQPRINEIYDDTLRIYKTSFEIEAVELFQKYEATHLIVLPGMKDIDYGDGRCFERIYATNIKIYEKNPECIVKVVA